jgi:hypothetical protein
MLSGAAGLAVRSSKEKSVDMGEHYEFDTGKMWIKLYQPTNFVVFIFLWIGEWTDLRHIAVIVNMWREFQILTVKFTITWRDFVKYWLFHREIVS